MWGVKMKSIIQIFMATLCIAVIGQACIQAHLEILPVLKIEKRYCSSMF